VGTDGVAQQQWSLVQAALTGDRLVTLEVLRNLLAVQLEEAPEPKDFALLAGRFTDVLAQIDDIPTSREASAADEIAARRAARRRGNTKGSARATRSS